MLSFFNKNKKGIIRALYDKIPFFSTRAGGLSPTAKSADDNISKMYSFKHTGDALKKGISPSSLRLGALDQSGSSSDENEDDKSNGMGLKNLLLFGLFASAGAAVAHKDAECIEAQTVQPESFAQKNKLQSRVFVTQYPANDPIEDRFNAHQLTSINGYYAAVFDGHGGWQVADLAKQKLHQYLDEELKLSPNNIKDAIKRAFDRVENEYVEIARVGFKNGFSKMAYVGSCALAAIVHEKKLFVANSGDCKAALFRRNKSTGKYEFTKVSTTFSANSKKEQERLKAKFKGDKDIVICKKPGACYVKGNLMPTRSFGDLRLKLSEFNYHNYEGQKEFRRPIPNFAGPYITHEPDIKEISLTSDDEYLVLATDGLWDELKAADVADVITELKGGSKEAVGEALFEKAISHAANARGLTKEALFNKLAGAEKRRIHDDITVLVMDLKNQV